MFHGIMYIGLFSLYRYHFDNDRHLVVDKLESLLSVVFVLLLSVVIVLPIIYRCRDVCMLCCCDHGDNHMAANTLDRASLDKACVITSSPYQYISKMLIYLVICTENHQKLVG